MKHLQLTTKYAEKEKFKTSFNYCSSGSGQNSAIPVVCNVPELKLYTQHATLSNYPQIDYPL